VQIRFPENHRACVAQARDHGGIPVRNVSATHSRCRRGGLAGDIDEILDRNGHAVQRATVDSTAALFV
jgi:hypothetical protein